MDADPNTTLQQERFVEFVQNATAYGSTADTAGPVSLEENTQEVAGKALPSSICYPDLRYEERPTN